MASSSVSSPPFSTYSANCLTTLSISTERCRLVSSETNPTAVVYLRVSTKEQAQRGGEAEGFSIPAQRAACLKKAESLGAAVVGEFIDAGESARSADRPELQRLLQFVASEPVSYVICTRSTGWPATATTT